MANLYSLCNDIEQFLQENDQNSINQFLDWIKQRLNINSNKKSSLINTSQLFHCQCGHHYTIRFEMNEKDQSHEQKHLDDLQSLEQLIPPDNIEYEQINSSNSNNFGLPKLTDSMIEIIHTDGKRQFRCPLCFNSYVNRSGLNRHYITHSSQDLWKVECQFCGKRYSRKDSLKHHIKTQHTQFILSDWIWKEKKSLLNEKEQTDNDDIVLVS